MRISNSWEPLRTGVVANEATLTTWDYNNAVYASRKFDIPKDWNSKAIAIAFWGTNAADEAVTAILWGRMRTNGPIMKLWAGTVTLGALVVTNDPILKTAVANAFWADTITLTAGVEWLSDPVLRNETADDDIAYILMNLYNINDVYLEITTINTAASINAIITGIAEPSREAQA